MTAPSKTRILVADDEPVLVLVMKEALEKEGFIVATAADGLEALASIRAKPPDIAVLDLRMPRMDGFEVCRKLRDDPLFAHLPTISHMSISLPRMLQAGKEPVV
jgi:two-component system alkaline phosphatase synthesis response regulator PhoP